MVVSGQPAGAREVGASVAQRLHEVDVVDRLIDRRVESANERVVLVGGERIVLWVGGVECSRERRKVHAVATYCRDPRRSLFKGSPRLEQATNVVGIEAADHEHPR